MKHNKTKMFTIIAELEGETSVAQKSAPSPGAAFEVWAATTLQRKTRRNVVFDVEQFLSNAGNPTPVKGCSNVWCTSGLVAGKLLLAHIVLTRPAPRPVARGD